MVSGDLEISTAIDRPGSAGPSCGPRVRSESCCVSRQVVTSTCDDADETRIFKNKGRVGHDSTHLKKGGLKISGASGSVLVRKMSRFSQRRLGSELASN